MDLFKQLFLIKSEKWDIIMFAKVLILWKIWICLNNCFWSNQKNGININKNCFSPKTEPHTAKLCLSVVLMLLGEIHRGLFFLDTKVTLSKKITEILRKFVFLTMSEKGQILRKVWICLKTELIKPSKGDKYLQKLFFFFHKVSHKLINLAFVLFWSILWEIHGELLFLDIKVAI